MAQGTVFECAVDSWFAKRTDSTAVTVLLPLGLFSPGLAPTHAISLLVGALLLWQVVGAGRLGHGRFGLRGCIFASDILACATADCRHNAIRRRVLWGSSLLQSQTPSCSHALVSPVNVEWPACIFVLLVVLVLLRGSGPYAG